MAKKDDIFKPNEDEEELVKVRDMINNYGGQNYGISDNMIGWDQNHGDEKGGSININGQKFMDMDASNIKDGTSYGKADDVKYAIDDYAKRNNLSSLRVDEEVSGETEDVTGPLDNGYEDPYGEKIDKYLDTILNREEFDFDVNESESYQALEDQYEIKGDRAMEDVMGAASQMTGGRTNSWSETVAAQAKNRFNDELLGKIPALEQAAFQQYATENQMNAQALNSLLGVSDQKFGRFADQRNFDRGVMESDRGFNRSVLESDRNFNFQSEQAEEASDRWEKEYDYKVTRDKINDEKWLKQFDYQKQQDAISNAYKNRQISLSEANTALRKAQMNRDQSNQEVSKYMDYAVNQLAAGKSEKEVKDYMKGLKDDGQISDAAYQEVINRFPAAPKEAGSDNVVALAYKDMMSAEGPQAWLTESAPYLTTEELKDLERMLPKDGAVKQLIQQLINE